MSDLHMEMTENMRYIKTIEFVAKGDVLVLAGDSFYLRDTNAPHLRFWKWASENFQQVLLVPGNHEKMYYVHSGMNDFRQIMYNGRRFTPEDFNLEHEKCLRFLQQAVKASEAEHIVVVSHHLPTFKVLAQHHMGSKLNGAFVTELGKFITDSRIDVWIYGHSHTNIDKTIGNTKIISNQLGYTFLEEHLKNSFEPGKTIEL